jgi:polyhydroxybutyrate depolymerase
MRSFALALASLALAACSSSSSATDAARTGASTTVTRGGASTSTTAHGGAGGAATSAGGAGQGGATSSGGAGHGGATSGGGAGQGGATTTSGARACKATTFGGDRPADLHVPPGYACGTPAPLLIVLHGLSATGAIEEAYLGFQKVADDKGFLTIHPDGTVDKLGEHFWNATPGCCDFFDSGVDDVGYLLGLVDAISAEYDVDPKRVYLFGHSNGAFMAYRMACDHAERFAAIGALAGAMYLDPADCHASEPVSVLAIHGTADTNVHYEGGGAGKAAYPSAQVTVQDWATIDGCNPTPVAGAPLDLVAAIAGDETTVSTFTGCKAGASVELRTMVGAGHIPVLSKELTPSPEFEDFLRLRAPGLSDFAGLAGSEARKA